MAIETHKRLQGRLAEYGQRYPTVWREYDYFRSLRGNGLPRWPEWCYCPLAAAYAVVSGGGKNTVPLDRLRDIGILGALAAWRMTKGIYRYDPDLFAALQDTPMDGTLPSEILYYIPEWCVYVEVPANVDFSWGNWRILGWFAYLEWDSNTARPELRFVIETENRLIPMPIHLTQETLNECIKEAVEEGCAQAQKVGVSLDPETCAESITEPLIPLVSVTLYLCSAAADIADRRGKREHPDNPRAVKTKRGPRIFPASNPTEWDVGFRIGASLRLARHEPSELGDGGHASPRPHIRRAHWHSYWTGPQKGERKIILKWLPPIPVGAGELVPAIHKVE